MPEMWEGGDTMTDKYCPLRFREFGSQPHDQRCIEEYCAWFEKCSQSHGEPRTDTEDTQTRVRTETDTETAQEPREADENANDDDTREKLEADVLDAGCADEIDYDRIIGWLDRQAAITDAEWDDELEQLHMGYKSLIDELTEERDLWNKRYSQSYDYALDLQAQLDKLSSDELHWRSEAEFWRCKYELIAKAVNDVARNYVDSRDEGMA